MTSRTCLALAAALGAGGLTSLAAVPAQGAVAALQDDRLVSAPLETIDARLDRLQRTGTRVARFDIFWNEVARTRPSNPRDPEDPAYDWDRADKVLTGMQARGIRPIVSVYSTPTWSAGRNAHNTQYNPYAPRPGDFGKFMQAVATRYSGDFIPTTAPSSPGTTTTTTTTTTTSTPALPTEPLPGVRVWEIWNEPNLKRFLHAGSASRSLPTYIRLVREAYPVVKKANPRAVVLIGATGPRSTSGSDGIGARQWLTGLMKAPLSMQFDAYSQHIYPSAAPVSRTKAFPSWNSFPDMFDLLDARREREIKAARGSKKAKLMRTPKTRIFVTEAGYTTQFTTFRKVRVTNAQQAKYLRQIYRLAPVRSQRVPTVVWFNMQDNSEWPGGLISDHDVNKPSYAAFRAVSRQGGLPQELRR